MYDVLVKGGTVIDPAQGIHAAKDLAIKGGHTAALRDSISTSEANEVIDATGKLVLPGLVDIHVHVYPGVSHFGTEADPACLAKGVTTAIDAGSAGAHTFLGFRRHVLETVKTRLLAFLNISSMGMISQDIGELEDIRWADVAKAVETVNNNRDYLVGMKVRQSTHVVGQNGLEPLKRTREAADVLGVTLMVHPGATLAPLKDILVYMKKGDVLTHCFHNRGQGVLDEGGRVEPEVWEAVRRGVNLDVGHGVGSFSWDVAEKCLSQGLVPATISTDIHFYNIDGPVYDLATTMSKFLHLGMKLDDIIRMSTTAAAAAVGLGDGVGTLRVGAEGDVCIFELAEGKFPLVDAHKKTAIATQRFLPYMTLRAGKVAAKNGKLNEE
ncbi:MAG: amidohydrolase/deacetylase family metallohydrolase [Chloroflexi bacterium]|nr:amidohydrolase/deacetylase family metallohydrolase [Chloroflexota bacterium]